MSGVIDQYGQWEHCNHCGRFVLIQNLEYRGPGQCSAEFHEQGCDICHDCNKKEDTCLNPV